MNNTELITLSLFRASYLFFIIFTLKLMIMYQIDIKKGDKKISFVKETLEEVNVIKEKELLEGATSVSIVNLLLVEIIMSDMFNFTHLN